MKNENDINSNMSELTDFLDFHDDLNRLDSVLTLLHQIGAFEFISDEAHCNFVDATTSLKILHTVLTKHVSSLMNELQ